MFNEHGNGLIITHNYKKQKQKKKPPGWNIDEI